MKSTTNFIFLIGIILQLSHVFSTSHNYMITKTWNNQTTEAEIHISFTPETNSEGNVLRVNIDAPFFNDPLAPEAPTDQPYDGLWEFEVVEAFFLGDDIEYLELEFAPSSHYLLLYLKGVRNDTGRHLPLTDYVAQLYNTTDNQARWRGNATIPGGYFPCNITKFNAYAIQKSGDDRRYMSLFPVAEGELVEPNFHYLEGFQGIDLEIELNSECTSTTASNEISTQTSWTTTNKPETTTDGNSNAPKQIIVQSFLILLPVILQLFI